MGQSGDVQSMDSLMLGGIQNKVRESILEKISEDLEVYIEK